MPLPAGFEVRLRVGASRETHIQKVNSWEEALRCTGLIVQQLTPAKELEADTYTRELVQELCASTYMHTRPWFVYASEHFVVMCFNPTAKEFAKTASEG